MTRTLPLKAAFGLFAALLASLVLLSAACGDGTKTPSGGETPSGSTTPSGDETPEGTPTDEEEAVEAAIRAFFEAYNDKDVDGLLAALSDSFIEGALGTDREGAVEQISETIGNPQQELQDIENISVTGNSATAETTFAQDGILLRERETLVKEGDTWLFEDFIFIETPIPDGMKTVDLTLSEYEFDFDDGEIPDDEPFAFKVLNSGEAEHEVDLERVPEDLDIDAFVESQSLPDDVDVESLTLVGPFAPGEEGTLVFAEALAPGRYVMFSFSANDEGVTDAENGMWAEFTIE